MPERCGSGEPQRWEPDGQEAVAAGVLVLLLVEDDESDLADDVEGEEVDSLDLAELVLVLAPVLLPERLSVR
jgi:hypothetical protein